MTHDEVQNKKCVTYLCTSHTKHNVLDHFNVCSCREPGQRRAHSHFAFTFHATATSDSIRKSYKIEIKQNDFHSPPLEHNPLYEYIDYTKTSRYTINTFITIPNTEQSQNVERHDERRQLDGQFTETSSNTDGHTQSLGPQSSPEDKHTWRGTSGELTKYTMAVSESHPTADQCIDSKNVEQSQTVDFISSSLLHTSSTVRWQPIRQLHGHLPTCGDSLSVGFRSSLDPKVQQDRSSCLPQV